MSDTYKPADTFDVAFYGYPPGLVGTVRKSIVNDAGAFVANWSTAGIVEAPVASGNYLVSFVAPGPGEYHALFDDGTGHRVATEDFTVLPLGTPPPATPEGITPAVAEVGALIRERTLDAYNNYRGTFTSDSQPTAAQVEELIAKAVARVVGKIGDPPYNAKLIQPAREVAALGAAMRVELSFFGSQVAANRSPFNELKALHDEAMKELVTLAVAIDDASGIQDPLAPGGMAAWSFPDYTRPFNHVPGSESPTDAVGIDW